MANDEWNNGTTNGNNWSTYNYNNNAAAGWNEPNNPTINYQHTPPTYVTTTSRQQPPQPPQHRPSPKKDGFSSLFVAETSFPSWDD
jgi:hypothetical protein